MRRSGATPFMKRNRRNDACERGGIAARRFPPSSRRQPVPTGRRRLCSNQGRGERPDRPARDPGGPRSDAFGPGSSEITEGFGDRRNPP